MILMGAFAAIILNIGLLPPYPEMWKRGGRVVGISKYAVDFTPYRLHCSRFYIPRHGFAGGMFLFVRHRYDLTVPLA